MRKLLLFEIFFVISFLPLSAQTFQWAKQLVALPYINALFPSFSSAKQIVTDDLGNIYAMGMYNCNTDFNPGLDTFYLTASMGPSEFDYFVAKFDSNGNFLWVKNIGNFLTYCTSIQVRNNTEIYISGSLGFGADMDPGAGTSMVQVQNGYQSGFILKLDSAGDFKWVKSISGINSGFNSGNQNGVFILEIDFDNQGNILLGGNYNGIADFDPDIGTFNLTSNGIRSDAFIAKWNSNGSFVWAKSFGNANRDRIISLKTDTQSNIVALGSYNGDLDLDPGSSIYNIDSIGKLDIFILKLDSLGNFVWGKNLGGTKIDSPNKIKIDNLNNIYVSGSFDSTINLNPANLIPNFLLSKGKSDNFLVKLDDSGNHIWSRAFGSKENDFNYGMFLDNHSNTFLCGYFQDSVNLDSSIFNLLPTPNSIYKTCGYIVKLDSLGNYTWAQKIGDTITVCYSVVLDKNQNVIAFGDFSKSNDFDPSSNINILNSVGYSEVFILKLKASSNTSSLIEKIDLDVISMFPNPNSGLFNLILKEKSSIQIYDAIGREIYKQKLNVGSHQIQLSEKANGIYFMKIKTDKAIYTEQIIINH